MTVIDLTAGTEIAFEDEPDEVTGLDDSLTSRRDFAPRRQRTVIRFDGRTYTLEEFRAWVRRLRDVELSTDPEQAGVVERMREQARRQEETASAVVGMLAARDRERWENLRRVTAERDALIAENASQPSLVHQVAWEAHHADLGPISPRQGSYTVDTGAVTLTCACGWSWTGRSAEAEAVATEHEGGTP